MEESWINLNVQQAKAQKSESQHDDDADEVISGPSTASSTSSSSSTASLNDTNLKSSGSTDENLGASFGTLLRKGEAPATRASDEQQDATGASIEAEKERRDTITMHDRPRQISAEKQRARKQRRREKAAAASSTSYWSGFYTGLTLGISTLFLGLACWRLSLRFRLAGVHW